MQIQHSIDCLQLYGYQGAAIDEVIEELEALKAIAKEKRYKNIRVIIAPRNNMAQIDANKPVDSHLRLFVVAEKGGRK